MKILITGATGLIGRSLCQALTEEGHRVIALSRSPEKAKGIAAAEVHAWDPTGGLPPAKAIEGVDSVVHLAGEPVAARRWSEEQKRRIRDSRVLSTRHLVNELASGPAKPASFISSSAVGFYGDRGDEPLDESSPAGEGFLSEVCEEWEREAERAKDYSLRVVCVRTGVVLAPAGGALKKMLPAFKLGVAGRLGGGNQWFPWIHLDDIVGIFRHAILSPSLEGPVNGVAPGIVTNAEFTSRFAGALRRPAFLPVPEFALRLLMGEMADVLLASQCALPKAILEAGYSFKHPLLGPALADLLGKSDASEESQKRNAAKA